MTNQPTAVTLLPCPMDGGDAIIIQEDRVWIECADCLCKVEVGPFNTEAEAITAWNTRSPQPPSSDTRLREALANAVSALCSVRKNYEDRSLGLWVDVSAAITNGNAALQDTAPPTNGGEGK